MIAALFAEHLGIGFILAALVGTWWICRREDRRDEDYAARLRAMYSPARPHGDQAERATRRGGDRR